VIPRIEQRPPRQGDDYDSSADMYRVGRATPGSHVGDIWVSGTLIDQLGMQAVRERVRDIYTAAYRNRRPRQ
jgi:hypothetical protein